MGKQLLNREYGCNKIDYSIELVKSHSDKVGNIIREHEEMQRNGADGNISLHYAKGELRKIQVTTVKKLT